MKKSHIVILTIFAPRGNQWEFWLHKDREKIYVRTSRSGSIHTSEMSWYFQSTLASRPKACRRIVRSMPREISIENAFNDLDWNQVDNKSFWLEGAFFCGLSRHFLQPVTKLTMTRAVKNIYNGTINHMRYTWYWVSSQTWDSPQGPVSRWFWSIYSFASKQMKLRSWLTFTLNLWSLFAISKGARPLWNETKDNVFK